MTKIKRQGRTFKTKPSPIEGFKRTFNQDNNTWTYEFPDEDNGKAYSYALREWGIKKLRKKLNLQWDRKNEKWVAKVKARRKLF